VELSVATLTNWAAKTANWLTEEIEIEPGDKVVVRLPAHWQTAGILLGAWWCGAHIVSDEKEAQIVFVGPEEKIVSGITTAIVSLDPMGRGLSRQPEKASIDFLSEVRAAGDEFHSAFPIPGNAPAMLSSTVDELLIAAREVAVESAISQQDRVLSTVEWSLPDGILRGLLAPLAAGAHLVQVTGAAPENLDNYRRNERTTVDLLE
jgi:uncharacterized protein (TIGR03089 family)